MHTCDCERHLIFKKATVTASAGALMMRPESMSLKKLGAEWAVISSPPQLLPFSLKANTFSGGVCLRNVKGVQRLRRRGGVLCGARRRAVRYGGEEDGEEEYGHNEEIAMLEFYSQSAKGEALIVHAVVDDEEVQVLIFKGFSSSLSYRTSPDPSRSILPARAVIKSIDRIKGPFDPSNTEYIQKGLTWEAFKTSVLAN
ncbi:uncharacterized protein LOC132179224 [Corylus avellana]|uniref:uncharacterized protein LOC132179224 n=1 Tax=Corylus avellana TaxID=13451 RepID=UPI00286D6406|nr:uncharacterized protein LOC132179224 [Corylus avellana]